MPNLRTIFIDVGRGVHLEAIELSPVAVEPFCTIVFSTGICMTCRDLMKELLQPLAEHLRILSYSYRGHGESGGIFDPITAVSDLEKIIKKQSGPVFLMGYSTGCGVNTSVKVKTSGHILLSPYLELRYLNRIRQLVLRGGKYISWPIRIMDVVISFTGIGYFLRLKNKHPLGDVVKIKKMKAPRTSLKDVPAIWMVPDHDEVLGTWRDPEHFDLINRHLKALYPKGNNKSELVTGLNHLFNMQVGNLFHAFKCDEEVRQMLLFTILNFCRSNI